MNTLLVINNFKILKWFEILHFHYSISLEKSKIDVIDFYRKNEKINDTILHFKLKYEKCEAIFIPLEEISFYNHLKLYQNGN